MNKTMMEMKFLMIQQWMTLSQEMRNNMKDFAKWINNVIKDNVKFIQTSLKLWKKVLMEQRSTQIIDLWLMNKFQAGSYRLQRSLKIKRSTEEETGKESKSITPMILLTNNSLKCVNKMRMNNLKMLVQATL